MVYDTAAATARESPTFATNNHDRGDVHPVVDRALVQRAVRGSEGQVNGPYGVLRLARIGGEEVRELVADELGALRAELAMAVEDAEEVEVGVALQTDLASWPQKLSSLARSGRSG